MGKSLCRGLIILSILAWCAYVSGDGPRQVNCEVYVYHPNCRGMQAKKRFMTSAENDKADPACPCGNSKKLRNNELDKLANSKLLEAMLAKGFDVDLLYDAYVATVDRRRNYNLNRDRPNRGGSKSLPKDGSTDFSNTEIVEDY
ncbi:uncharacterized protein [Venturia canescens]|uniref:uncharacterized protein isoform X2 n=1 Tax=Venturia canescens TaxID=32260 RepID=UPI001C9C25DF|nr:uncharacterized protein LOC122414466 isoform X2 [Venturia canescens]